MPVKKKRFADDGWAIWVEGDDTSTVYLNDWINPNGTSYIDFALRILNVSVSKTMSVYMPFCITREEIEDVSLLFHDKNILQATFSSSCIVDYKKNEHTSEIAYNGKTVDIVHISTLDFRIRPLASGSILELDLEPLKPFLANDEAYFIWRMPHKTLNEIFSPYRNMGTSMERLRDLITTPIVTEKYGYSIRINESRLLPDEITRIGSFHRQKLKKAVVTISVGENYELNDMGCFRIRRLEENLYKEFLPKDYCCEDVITYQWNQSRSHNLQGQFNFYYNITRNSVKKGSMLLYLVLLLLLGAMGDIVAEGIKAIFRALT